MVLDASAVVWFARGLPDYRRRPATAVRRCPLPVVTFTGAWDAHYAGGLRADFTPATHVDSHTDTPTAHTSGWPARWTPLDTRFPVGYVAVTTFTLVRLVYPVPGRYVPTRLFPRILAPLRTG